MHLQVKIEDRDNGTVHKWTAEKFRDKLIMMRDAL